MFERFTDDARASIVRSQQEAHDLSVSLVGPECLLLGVLSSAEGQLADVLARYGLTVDAVRQRIVPAGPRGTANQDPVIGHIRFADQTKKAMEYALRESLERDSDNITATHLLLGLLRTGDRHLRKLINEHVRTDDLRSALIRSD